MTDTERIAQLEQENEALVKAAEKYHDSQECAWCYDNGQCDLADALAEYAKPQTGGNVSTLFSPPPGRMPMSWPEAVVLASMFLSAAWMLTGGCK